MNFWKAIELELARADAKHASIQSEEEGEGILIEEIREFEDEVRSGDHGKAAVELAQCCAVICRMLRDAHGLAAADLPSFVADHGRPERADGSFFECTPFTPRLWNSTGVHVLLGVLNRGFLRAAALAANYVAEGVRVAAEPAPVWAQTLNRVIAMADMQNLWAAYALVRFPAQSVDDIE